MKLRRVILSLAFAASSALAVSGAALAEEHHGEDMNVHNHTGHEVLVFLFQDDHVHLSEAGGAQVAHLKDGESAVAHVPNCQFSIVLVDHEDVWHAEFHDCTSTDMSFTKDTGHDKKKH